MSKLVYNGKCEAAGVVASCALIDVLADHSTVVMGKGGRSPSSIMIVKGLCRVLTVFSDYGWQRCVLL